MCDFPFCLDRHVEETVATMIDNKDFGFMAQWEGLNLDITAHIKKAIRERKYDVIYAYEQAGGQLNADQKQYNTSRTQRTINYSI